MGLNKRLISTAAAGIVNTENFTPFLYDGGGSQSFSIGFAADLVFIKNRTVGQGWSVWDTVRGASNGYLKLETTDSVSSPFNMLTFDSDGFNVSDNGGAHTQTSRSSSGDKYVSYAWKAGGAAVSNTDGTITAQVSANPDAGFSIGTYTGNSTAGATIGHGLSSTPELMIVKLRSGIPPKAWTVYAEALGNTDFLYLNSTNGASAYNFWNNTSPTNSVFSVSSDTNVNSNLGNYVFYAFHSVNGYQKVGTYTASNSWGTSAVIDVGFPPRFVLVKSIDNTGSWLTVDSLRGGSNGQDRARLYANLNGAEGADTSVDFSGNTFSITFGSTGNQGTPNVSRYMYLAIA
jgi:hypothetical protein